MIAALETKKTRSGKVTRILVLKFAMPVRVIQLGTIAPAVGVGAGSMNDGSETFAERHGVRSPQTSTLSCRLSTLSRRVVCECRFTFVLVPFDP